MTTMNLEAATGWRERISALELAGDRQATLRAMREEASAAPDDLDVQIGLAVRCREAGLWDEATDTLHRVADAPGNPLQFIVLLETGNCEIGRKNFAEAETAYRRAMELDPGSHWPIQGIAETFVHRGREPERLPFIEANYEQLRPDGRAQIARYAASVRDFSHYENLRPQSYWQPRMPGRVPALAHCGMILLIKDEDDIIGKNLEHHYQLGFRAFYIVNNMSVDATRSRLEAFRANHPDAFVVIVDDPVAGHYQGRKMEIYSEAFINHARLADIDMQWMFFIDADEFISFAGEFAELGIAAFDANLNDPAANLIVLHWIHAASQVPLATTPEEADPFTVFTKLCSHLAPVVPKVAIRIGRGLKPMEGNHFVPEFPFSLESVRTLGLHDWYLVHFSLRSIEHTRKKVINGGLALRSAKGLEGHGGHWRERYGLYEKYGESIITQILDQHVNGLI